MELPACAKTKWYRAPFNILTVCLVAACAGPGYKAPVSEVAQPPSIQLQEHLVVRGDTLYSIAWRYNLDHRDLARANGIDSSYIIYPGQRLTLDVTRRPASSSSVSTAEAPVRRAAKPVSVVKPSSPSRSKNQTNSSTQKNVPAIGKDPAKWQWPVRGPLLAGFASNNGLNKGIDIGGKLGEPVLAAAAGDVVYSGSGLRGYGKLVIVKHNEKYLSAYAHNRKLLVEEGDVVKAGQRIAEVGSSGTDTVKLHFEIRYDGKPVNPLNYLPRQ